MAFFAAEAINFDHTVFSTSAALTKAQVTEPSLYFRVVFPHRNFPSSFLGKSLGEYAQGDLAVGIALTPPASFLSLRHSVPPILSEIIPGRRLSHFCVRHERLQLLLKILSRHKRSFSSATDKIPYASNDPPSSDFDCSVLRKACPFAATACPADLQGANLEELRYSMTEI